MTLSASNHHRCFPTLNTNVMIFSHKERPGSTNQRSVSSLYSRPPEKKTGLLLPSCLDVRDRMQITCEEGPTGIKRQEPRMLAKSMCGAKYAMRASCKLQRPFRGDDLSKLQGVEPVSIRNLGRHHVCRAALESNTTGCSHATSATLAR